MRWVILAACVMALGSGAAYVGSLSRPRTIGGLRVAGRPMGDVDFAVLDGRIDALAGDYLSRPLRFILGGETVTLSRRDAGFVVDRASLRQRLTETGKRGRPIADVLERLRARRGRLDLPMPLSIDRARALEALSDVKDRLDRPAVDAKLDLDHHTIAKEQDGYLVQVYQSLVNLEYAAQQAADSVGVAAVVTPPAVTAKDLGQVDIGVVLGAWQTPYSMAVFDSDRTYNLKVGAGKVDGTVIQPHQVFSFNQVTGDRTEKEGYRVAPVIQAGELVDGLAGGMCQIASTLHAASWFAGLDILESTPHSRPSAYITMGLDSTVVYPTTDLKLRNPYDFPVIIHYKVNQGNVRAEILGKERPVKVAFERETLETVPFGHQKRGDPTLPSGQKILDQEGHEGFRIKRRRIIYEKRIDQPIRKPEERVLSYPPTAEIVRIGTGPAKLPKKPQGPAHHIPKPEKPNTKEGFYRLIR